MDGGTGVGRDTSLSLHYLGRGSTIIVFFSPRAIAIAIGAEVGQLPGDLLYILLPMKVYCDIITTINYVDLHNIPIELVLYRGGCSPLRSIVIQVVPLKDR